MRRSTSRDVSDSEFDQRVQEVLDSDWPGQPVQVNEEAPLLPYSSGDRVCWIGPPSEGPYWNPEAVRWHDDPLGGVLTASHPGTIVEVDHRFHVLRVSWVDSHDEVEGPWAIAADYLAPLSDDEASRLTAVLRESDWPGLPNRPE